LSLISNVFEDAMLQAIEIAKSALASGDVPVGAIVLNSAGEVVETKIIILDWHSKNKIIA